MEKLALTGSDGRSDSPRRRLAAPFQAHRTGASILHNSRTDRVAAIAADETPILIGDHKQLADAHDAVRAADAESCVSHARDTACQVPGILH